MLFQVAYLKQNENSGDLTKKSEKKSGLSNLNSSDSSKGENTLHAEDVNTIEGKDDDTNVTDGITTIQNILRDLIPGVKVRVLKLVSPGKVDRDLIAKVVEQIMEEEEESSEEDDSDEELESLETDDIDAEHDIEDFEMDSGDSTGKHEGKSEVSLKVVISGLTPKLSADVPPANLVRVPARLEKRDHMSFSIILEQDVIRSVIDEKRQTLKRKAFARQNADILSSELAKVIPNKEKIHLKVSIYLFPPFLCYRYADGSLPGGIAKIDRRRSISAVDGRLREKSIIGGRLREKKGKRRKKKKRKRRKKKKRIKRKKNTSFPHVILVCVPSSPACDSSPP
ncbi:hypothetical protein BHM03_00006610 [Ensete ventricosum]|nr:hypothetical protein BHM03_00006610 [Ensete ventricosum]